MKAFHECELKLKINNQEVENTLRSCLAKTGFVKTDFRVETDCVLDTKDNAFGNMLFRLRRITRESAESILFTVKIQGSSESFQDNMELEITPDDYSFDNANVIVETIQKKTGIDIPVDVFSMKNRESIVLSLEKKGIYVKRSTKKSEKSLLEKMQKLHLIFSRNLLALTSK